MQTAKKLYFQTNLQIIFGVTLIGVMGVASLSPAFPMIIQKFNISKAQIGLLITVFTVPGVVITPILGVLADRFGRKRILVPSLFLFSIAGTACAFMTDFHSLLILRFFQGVGAAALGSLNVTLIGDIFQGPDRSRAMGYNASVLSVGTAAYPAIGGALALFGWNYPFLLPIVALPAGLAVLFFLESPSITREQSFRAYLAAALRGLWNRQVFVLFTASVVTFIILYGTLLTHYPILIAYKFKGSTLVIGIIMSVMSLTTAFVSSQMGRITAFLSEKSLVKIAFALYAVSLSLVPFMPTLETLIVPTMIFGIAHGLNIPSLMTLLAGMAPLERRGAFLSINGMVLRLGQTLGPVIIGLFFSIWGIDAAFFAGAAFGVAMACLAVLLL